LERLNNLTSGQIFVKYWVMFTNFKHISTTEQYYWNDDLTTHHYQKYEYIVVEHKYPKFQTTSEMYHGIKFSDLKDILTFIVNNYDQSIEYINNFIKVRLSNSLEEEDEIPPALDLKKITYQIGDHEEVIDLEQENEKDLKKELKNIMRCYKETQERSEDVIVINRKELVNQLNQFTNETKTSLAASLPGAQRALWNRIKELTGWKASKAELEQSDSEEESFKYKIVY
jgi:hypothetical protein